MQEWSFFMINLLGLVQRKAMEVKMLGNIIFHLNSAKKWDAKLFWYQFTSVIPQMIFTYLSVFLPSYIVSMLQNCIFRKNCASVPEERSAIPLQTEQSSAGLLVAIIYSTIPARKFKTICLGCHSA